MEMLREIARIVRTRLTTRQVRQSFVTGSDDELYSAYLEGLLDSKFVNDEQAAQALSIQDPNDVRYQDTKARAFDRLMQSFLFLEVRRSEYSDYQLAYHRCTRNLLAAQLLHFVGANTAAIHIANKLLGTSLKYQFVEITLSAATLLRDVYITGTNDALSEKCSQLCSTCFEQLVARYESDDTLDAVRVISQNRRHEPADLQRSLEAILHEHSRLLQVHNGHYMQVNHYRLEVVSYTLLDRPGDVITVCDSARQYVQQHRRRLPDSLLGEFHLYRMQSLLATGREATIREEFSSILPSFKEGTSDWFKCILCQVVAVLRSGSYQDALGLLLLVASQHASKRLSPDVIDSFAASAAFVQLLHHLGKVEASAETLEKIQTMLRTEGDSGVTMKDLDLIVARICSQIVRTEFDEALCMMEALDSFSQPLRNDPYVARVQDFTRRLRQLLRSQTTSVRSHDIEAEMPDSTFFVASSNLHNWHNEPIPLERLFAYVTASRRSALKPLQTKP